MPFAFLERTLQQADAVITAVAARFAPTESLAELARRHLAERLGRMRGLPQKLGQMASMALTPEQGAADFAFLQDQAEPWPLDDLLAVLEQQWKRPVSRVITEIDPVGHAASLGQVHRAVLVDGREVAIKIQYPGIREAVHNDLAAMNWMRPFYTGGFDLEDYRQTVLTGLAHELDYRYEASAQIELAEIAQRHLDICIPQVYSDLSTEQVLVTQWEEGLAWEEVQHEWSDDDKSSLAQSLVAFFLDGLFRERVMQADWHAGNLRFRQTPCGPQWVLYDFGALCRLSEYQTAALSQLIRAARRGDDDVWNWYIQLGFHEDRLHPLADRLPAVTELLLQPFLQDASFDSSSWRINELMTEALGEYRWNFRMAAPAALLPLVRAYHGVHQYLTKLGPARWNLEFDALVADLAGEGMPAPFARHSERPVQIQQRPMQQGAQWLKLRVRKGGETVAQLTFAASVADRIDELIDHDLRAKLNARGIVPANVAAQAREAGFAPGTLFEVREPNHEVTVWLE